MVLIPLALRGVKFRATSAAAVLRRNMLIYGVGGLIAPFIGIKLIDLVVVRAGGALMRRQLAHRAPSSLSCMTVLLGLAYPLVVTGIAQGVFHHQANGSLVKATTARSSARR